MAKKMWRPEEWELPVSIIHPQHSEVVLGIAEHEMIYEAGADAMLKAVIKEIESLYKIPCHFVTLERFLQSPYWRKFKEGI